MKIGQLTFHASHNYGSVLQAYALSQQIKKLGHDTTIINLRPYSQIEAYRILNRKGVHYLFSLLIYPVLKRRYNSFERFIQEVLPLSPDEYHSTEELQMANFPYDAYVCGGDQIWNPACQDFEPAYYLQFLSPQDRSIKVSYSPSLGKNSFRIETMNNIASWIQCFDYISIREETGKRILQPLTENNVHVVCDPVLLLNEDDWTRLAIRPKHKKPYILVYFLENNHGSRDLIDYLHKTLQYDVVLLNEYIRDFVKPYHKAYAASPEEFVGLMMHASFIYTNSFHGTLFATLFEKPFLTAIAADQEHTHNNNDSRKIDYLSKIGMTDRLYTNDRPVEKHLLDIDYTCARKRIAAFKADSLKYLEQALKK